MARFRLPLIARLDDRWQPVVRRAHRQVAADRSLVAVAPRVRAAAPVAAGPSNDLLIVGYDREPDTLNRFSTHILEDIQTCVIEGLTITDEQMNVVPLLAAEVPTLDNGGVRMRADGGMDVTWKLRPGVKWHDGTPHTSADVKFTVDAINDPSYNPESTDGFDRIASVDTPDPLTAVVHYKEVYAPYALQFVRGTLPKHVLAGRDIDTAHRLQPLAARHRPLPRGRVEERRVHPARARARTTGAAPSSRRSSRSCFASSPTPTRASTS